MRTLHTTLTIDLTFDGEDVRHELQPLTLDQQTRLYQYQSLLRQTLADLETSDDAPEGDPGPGHQAKLQSCTDLLTLLGGIWDDQCVEVTGYTLDGKDVMEASLDWRDYIPVEDKLAGLRALIDRQSAGRPEKKESGMSFELC